MSLCLQVWGIRGNAVQGMGDKGDKGPGSKGLKLRCRGRRLRASGVGG